MVRSDTTSDGVSEAAVRSELDEIIDPCSASRGTDHSVVEMGLLRSIDIDGGDVTVNMRLTTPACFMIPYFIRKTEERVGALDSVESVELTTDSGAEWTPEMMGEEAKSRRQEYLEKLEEHHRAEMAENSPGRA